MDHNRIRALREELKLSQVEFGGLFGVSPQTIQEWESPGGEGVFEVPGILENAVLIQLESVVDRCRKAMGMDVLRHLLITLYTQNNRVMGNGEERIREFLGWLFEGKEFR